MQVTVERPMLFLGKNRQAGEVIDSMNEPKLLDLSASVRHALVDAKYISDTEMKGAAEAQEQHINARFDQLDDRMKRIEALLDNLAGGKAKKG